MGCYGLLNLQCKNYTISLFFTLWTQHELLTNFLNRLFAVNRMECSYGAVSVFFSHLTSATYSSKNAFEWLQNHRGSTQKTSSLYQLGHKKSQSKILSRTQNLAMFSLTILHSNLKMRTGEESILLQLI